MSEGLSITTEQVDDFPVLLAVMERMTIPDLLDGQFPAIQQMRQGLKKRGVLYVGDCKMMSLEYRAYLQAGDGK